MEVTHTDIYEALKSARNINASVKKFLKGEGAADPKAIKFVKDLRDAFESKREGFAATFVEEHFEKFEPALLALVRYAHAEPISAIAQKVVERYGDEFNQTFEIKDDEKLKVTDQKNFDAIVANVFQFIGESLKAISLGTSPVLTKVLVYTIFEPRVAEYISSRSEKWVAKAA